MTTSWGEVMCGAALINDRYLLTASHCIYGQKATNFGIILGAHDLNVKSYTILKPEKFIVHENYEKSRQLNDIGLIKLKNPISFSREIQSICLPSDAEENFQTLIVAGWGRVREGGALSSKPKQVTIPQLPESRCFSAFGQFMTSNNICAGGMSQQDACQGDSGGPLVAKSGDGRCVIAGVTSFGIGCGRAGIPGAYTKVTNYLDWIREHSSDGQVCPRSAAPTSCGVARGLRRRKRIIGGTSTSILEFPWVAALVLNGQVRGAAILVSQRFLLTSAKNLKTIDPDGSQTGAMRIILGANDISQREAGKKVHRVAKVHFHPLFGSSHPFSMDFALIELSSDANPIFTPICLPQYDMAIYEEDPMTIAGWGRTSSTGPGSKKLLKATVNLKSVANCSSSYLNNVEPNMLCAAGQSSDACFVSRASFLLSLLLISYLLIKFQTDSLSLGQHKFCIMKQSPCRMGDEGGPLMMDVDGKSILLGVKSWGSSYGCSLPDKPSVFADVRWALPWISSLTGIPFE